MYEIEFSNQATKFIRNLQEDTKKRIKAKFKDVKINPFRYIKHYEGRYYKLRIGGYRALIDVNFQRKILFVRIFDKREKIYK